MSEKQFDLTVIGTGPGGYVAAIRAAQLGLKVAVIEKDQVGGVCLNWGCIPTKALLKSAEMVQSMKHLTNFGINAENISIDFPKIIKRSRRVATRLSKGVEHLFKKNQITVIKGHGKLESANEISVTEATETAIAIHSKNIIVATGARPRAIPGIDFDGKLIINSKDAMTLEKLPESMIVIGAGAIGVEFAYFYHTLGCQVTIVEMLPHILPVEDQEITDVLTTSFKKSKLKIHTATTVKQIEKTTSGVRVHISGADNEQQLEASAALVAIGVQANSENLGLENVGVNMEKGWIDVNKHFQTNIKNIYAIGDIIGPPWLAHVASAEGILAAEKIADMDITAIDYNSIPACTYCQPQVASIGLSESKAREAGYSIKVGKFPFQANGKSLAIGESNGMVKMIYDSETNQLLGAHIIHAEATELINELSVVKNNQVTAHDLIKTIHAHPTLSETIMEAAAASYDEAIHI